MRKYWIALGFLTLAFFSLPVTSASAFWWWGNQGGSSGRVYLMRGLGHLSPFGPLKRDLQRQGYTVQISGWSSWRRVARDALRHSNERLIIAGHSMGGKTAFYAGETVRARGVPVRVISLDPLCTWPRGYPNLAAVNIWGNYCLRNPAIVPDAQNVYIYGGGHVFYPTNANVRAEFVRATYWNE